MENDKELVTTLYRYASRTRLTCNVIAGICGVTAFILLIAGMCDEEECLYFFPAFAVAALSAYGSGFLMYINYSWKASLLKNITKQK
jgi:hypothetical protein